MLQTCTNGLLAIKIKKLLIAEALRKIKYKQPLDALDCKKCNMKFDKHDKLFKSHLMSCYRLTFDCAKCAIRYATYPVARLHFESCDGIIPQNAVNLFFKTDQVAEPSEELKEKVWNNALMIKHMKEVSIHKIKH